MSDYFTDLLASDQIAQSRWDTAAALACHQIALSDGITITPKELLEAHSVMHSLRLCVMLDDEPLNIERMREEVIALPTVEKRIRDVKLLAALEKHEASAIKEILSRPPDRRITDARTMERAKVTPAKAKMTAEEEARIIHACRQLKSHEARINYARAHGLVL